MGAPTRITLEFARARDSGDPYAFDFAPQVYLLRTPGGRSRDVAFPWSHELLTRLEALRGPDVADAVARELGATLREFLEPAGWDGIERQIADAVYDESPVVVTIRSSAAELYALPWELLRLRGLGMALGAIPTLLLRYEWPETRTRALSGAPGPGRVLFAWSDAGGDVPAEEHARALAETIAADVMPQVSARQLAEALRAAEASTRPVRALHLLCHGAPGDDGLLLGTPAARERVSPEELTRVLFAHADMVRLVTISACHSGDAALGGRLASVAQMLHRAGFAAVVASRFPLSVEGSTRLTRALYAGALARDGTLEEAVRGAKAALAHDVSSMDWAGLQLYAREADGDATRLAALLGAPPRTTSKSAATPETSSATPRARVLDERASTPERPPRPERPSPPWTPEAPPAPDVEPDVALEPPAPEWFASRRLAVALAVIVLAAFGAALLLRGCGAASSSSSPRDARSPTKMAEGAEVPVHADADSGARPRPPKLREPLERGPATPTLAKSPDEAASPLGVAERKFGKPVITSRAASIEVVRVGTVDACRIGRDKDCRRRIAAFRDSLKRDADALAACFDAGARQDLTIEAKIYPDGRVAVADFRAPGKLPRTCLAQALTRPGTASLAGEGRLDAQLVLRVGGA